MHFQHRRVDGVVSSDDSRTVIRLNDTRTVPDVASRTREGRVLDVDGVWTARRMGIGPPCGIIRPLIVRLDHLLKSAHVCRCQMIDEPGATPEAHDGLCPSRKGGMIEAPGLVRIAIARSNGVATRRRKGEIRHPRGECRRRWNPQRARDGHATTVQRDVLVVWNADIPGPPAAGTSHSVA